MIANFGFDRNPYRADVNFNDYYWFKDGFTPQELQTIEGMTQQIQFEDAVTGEGEQSRVSDYRKSRMGMGLRKTSQYDCRGKQQNVEV